MKVNQTFNFRKVSASKLAEQLAELDTEVNVNDNFDVIEAAEDGTPKTYRRKPVQVEIEVPEFAESLPELARNWITQNIADFVKSNYVDNFVQVGDHSWELIESEAAKSRAGSGRLSIPDELLKAAAASFGHYVGQVTGHEEVGKRLEKAAGSKFTQNAITKHLGECTVEMVDKLQARLDAWATQLAESGSEDADEMADAYDFLSRALERTKGRMTTDTTALIADVL